MFTFTIRIDFMLVLGVALCTHVYNIHVVVHVCMCKMCE